MSKQHASALLCALTLGLVGVSAPVRADPWKDESGHSRRGGWWEERGRADRRGGRRTGRGEERCTYDDGECRVEVKRERNGEVREERRCRGPAPYGYGPQPYYEAPPPPLPHGYAPPPPPPWPAPGGGRGGWIEPDGS